MPTSGDLTWTSRATRGGSIVAPDLTIRWSRRGGAGGAAGATGSPSTGDRGALRLMLDILDIARRSAAAGELPPGPWIA